MTVEEFVELHPLFAQCSGEMIAQALINAAVSVSESELGSDYELALRLEACHLLTLEMYGQQASLKGGESTVYKIKFKELIRRRVAGGFVT